MRKLYGKAIALLLTCICCTLTLHAENIDLTKLLPKGKSNMGRSVTSINGEHVLLVFSKGEGKTTPSNYGYVRLYNGNAMTLKAEKTIKKITCHFLKSSKEPIPEKDEVNITNGTLDKDNVWKGSAKEMSFYFYPPKGKTFALESVEVDYEEEGGQPVTKPDENKPKTEEIITDIVSFKKMEDNKVATLSLNNATVLGCNGMELFVEDNTALIRMLLTESGSWQRGDVVSCEVRGAYEDNAGLPTIKRIEKMSIKKISRKKIEAIYVASEQLSTHINKWVRTTFVPNKNVQLANLSTGAKCQVYDGAEVECEAIVAKQGSTLLLYPITSQDVTINFYDDKTNIYGDAQNVNINIKHSLKQEVYNTLSLPVTLTDAEIKAVFGKTTIVATFVEVKGEEVIFQHTNNGMLAGEAYLVKPQTDMETIFIPQTRVKTQQENGNKPFVGTLNVTTPPTASYYINKQYKLQPFYGNQQLKAFKGYFCNIGNAEGKTIVINKTTNGIEKTIIQNNYSPQPEIIYNLNGQRMALKRNALSKGVYIINGRKTLLK